MAKVNISLPDGLLEDIDAKAAELGTTRSGLIQEASAKYVTRLDEERAAEERQRRIDEAIAMARKIGAKLDPDWDGTAQIRKDRDGGWGGHGVA